MSLYHSTKGPVNYTVVGNPTIVDGVVSGFDSSSYITLPDVGSSFPQECVFTFTTGSDITSTQTVFNNYSYRVQISSGVINCFMRTGYNVGITKTSSGISVNTKYTVKISMTASGVGMYYKTADSGYVTIYEGSEVAVPVSSNVYIGHYDLTTQSFLGSIDLNSTYIKVDAQAWFGVCPVEVKKHQIMGPVRYTVVGNPTIVDGVASGFSENAYLSIASGFSISSNTKLEIGFRLSDAVASSKNSDILRCVGTGVNLRFYVTSAGKVGGSYKGSDGNVKYLSFSGIHLNEYFKFTREGNDIKLLSSSDNQNWTTLVDSNNGLSNMTVTSVYFGGGENTSTYGPLNGSIDLNNTYIKVNGKLWFYQPADTKYIVKDGKLVWANPNIYLSGPVNYTVVGNPTIVDGVASGFSDSNYLQINTSPFTPNNITEVVIKFTPTEQAQGYILGGLTANGQGGIYLTIVNQQFRYGLVSEKTGQRTASSAYQITQLDVPYYMHFVFDGSTLNWKLGTSTDGLNPIYGLQDVATEMLTTTILTLGKTSVNNFQLRGSIDLNNTYIKVNGQPWFGLCPVEVQKHQLMGPVGYTVVGSPTIVDGVVSGFSNNDYLITTQGINISQVEEIVVKFNLPSSALNKNKYNFLCRSATFRMYLYSYQTYFGAAGIDVPGVGSLNSSFHFQADTDYWFKYIKNNNSYTFLYSENGINWTEVQTKTGTISDSKNLFNIGIRTDNLEYFTGSIDLNSTYIKVNGKLWFYQPADTKYIVKDGKLVWADPRLALSGPVNYEVVGNPTIVDGVVSGFSASDYLKLTQNPSYEATDEIEWNTSFTTSNSIATEWVFAFNDPVTSTMKGIYYLASRVYVLYCPGKTLDLTYGLQTNTTYSVNFKKDSSGNLTALLKDENGNILKTATQTDANVAMSYNTRRIGLGFSTGNSGSIDLKETYIKVNDQLWFYGKNYASKNIAPVPAGYTFGNTTTPSIGYVDMRTQQFMAAPSGATIGRDE